MSGIPKDWNKIEGQKFGQLTVNKYIGRKGKDNTPYFNCSCTCGKTNVEKSINYLRGYGNKILIPSCGCLASAYTIDFNKRTKSNFDHKYNKLDENTYEIIVYSKNKEHKVIVDKYGLDLLINENRTITIDSRGYPYITREDDRRQLFLMNIFYCGFEFYDNNMNVIVDHKNGKILDNRFCNLRIADNFENAQNAKLRYDNTLGIKGMNLAKYDDRLRWMIRCRIQTHYKRFCKEVPLSKEGIKYILLWNIFKRKELHDDFANYGFEIQNKTYQQIIDEQTDILLHNLSNEQLHIFNNNGFEDEINKDKVSPIINKLKEQFKNLNLQEVVA